MTKRAKKTILVLIIVSIAIGLVAVALFLKFKKNNQPIKANVNNVKEETKKEPSPAEPPVDVFADKKSSTDEKSSIVTFANENIKSQFLAGNKLNPADIKQITGTNSYKVPLSQKDIKSTGEGVSVNENKIYRALATPNDPLFSQQWHLSKISAPAAWDITTGSSSVKVAVLDTGFGLNHQDLASKFDLANGWDFIHNDNSPMAGTDNWNGQFVYHGTMTAGLAAAATNNGLGVASIGWNVKILPIQVLDDNGYGDTYTVASAINYAVSRGAKVISLSLGEPDPDGIIRGAIGNAISNGVVVVAAAGNSNCNCIIYPANYPEVIAVGATDINDNRASFSTYGANLDVVAPGVGSIRTTYLTQSNQTSAYTTSAYGTSVSTPIVAGQAALIKSLLPNASVGAVDSYIKNGADKVVGMNGQNFTNEYGFGRINAYNSLKNYQWQYIGQSPSGNLVAGQKTTWTVSAKNTGTITWTNSG
ncbi:MAG: S8 family serine peptidase, partial [bacterium]|nr:S8 family serine peptidase [bacterium]